MSSCYHTERKGILCGRAFQLCDGDGDARDGAGAHLLLLLVALRPPHDGLDLLLVLGVQLAAVLGAHEHGGELEGRVLQARPLALDHCGGQDRHHVGGELGDRGGHPQQQARGAQVVPPARQLLDQRVRVQQREPAARGRGHARALVLQVAQRLEEDAVRRLVVAQVLLLARDDLRGLGRLVEVAQRQVQPVDVVRVLGHAVRVAHEEVDQLVREQVVARLAHHLDGPVHLPLAALQEELERAAVLAGQRVVAAGAAQVAPRLVVPRHVRRLLGPHAVAQQLRVLLHQALPLGQVEGRALVARQQQELQRASAVALALAVGGHGLGARARGRLAH
mmetsp:Transcript_24825/g.39068  ORF Transcript_24825/g.39068 Transcript_24825/m.39068 type:complete len:335 (-) Transcript_24825:58-1062(-)